MKTNATKDQTETQKRALIGVLLEDFSGCTLDATQASRKINDTFGVSYDWHEYANYLDFMVRAGLARENNVVRRSDGFTQYTIS